MTKTRWLLWGTHTTSLLCGGGLFLWSQHCAAQSGPSNCARTPQFALARGISAPILSTSDRMRSGLVLLSLTPEGRQAPPLQLPSWRDGGRLGGFVVTERGDIFVIPVPNVNTLENPPERQNWLYRVRGEDGQLETFAKIPVNLAPSQRNPYGLLGIAYDCERKLIYLTTVSGSTPDAEAGKVVVIDVATGAIKDEFMGIDAIGVGLVDVAGSRWLYLGSARKSTILGIKLNQEGLFPSPRVPATPVITLDPLNTIRARKIRFKNETLTVEATEFYYNLVAQTEFEQPTLAYRWDGLKWGAVLAPRS